MKGKTSFLRAPSCPLFPARSAYKAPDAILQMYDIEVYKQSDRFTTEFEVRKDLRLMHGRGGLNRLDLDHNQILRQQIDAVAELELHSEVNDRKA